MTDEDTKTNDAEVIVRPESAPVRRELFEELVEASASAYYGFCRKLAARISKWKAVADQDKP